MNSVQTLPLNAPVLLCEAVSARYGKIVVCSGIDLQVSAREVVALVGPNGAGKSSLLGAIAGSVAAAGNIVLRGRTVTRLPAYRRANLGVSLVPEVRGNVFGPLSVRENIDIGVSLLDAASRLEMVEYILTLFPILKERLTTPAFMLSGGEQQMLAIGMAVGRKPSVLLLDEPTQGLAPTIHDILEGAIDALKQREIAIVLAEQNLPFARRVTDRFVALVGGQVTATGSKEDLGSESAIHGVFFGTEATLA
jgi:branched-chain amino acid transport system ATP-binding protein